MNSGIERLKYIIAVVLYGTIGMFLRQVSIPSEIVVLFRGTLGAVFILLYQKSRHRKMDWQAISNNKGWLLLSGVCLGLNWIFLFAAYIHTTVAIASLCNYMAPAVVVVIAPLVLKEQLEKKKIPCVIAAFIGIILVSGFWKGNAGKFSGVLMGLGAAASFVGVIICNRKIKNVNSFDKSIIQLFVSALTVLPYVLIKDWGVTLDWNARSVFIILMLGILQTGVAYVLYFSGMATLPVQTVAVLGYLEPVVSVFCSAAILHERMDLWGWIGAVMILGAAFISETIAADRTKEITQKNQRGAKS